MTERMQIISDELAAHAASHLGVSVALWIIVIGAILVDLADGVFTARRLGEPVRSHRLRLTIAKIGEYWRLMLIGFFIDSIGLLLPAYSLPYVSMVMCAGLVLTEAKSMLEHARRRHSSVSGVDEICARIVKCACRREARDIVKLIKAMQGHESAD